MKITGASDAYYAQLVAGQKTPTAATNADKSESVAVTVEKPSNSSSAGYAGKPSIAMFSKIEAALKAHSNEVRRIQERNVDHLTKAAELRAAAKEFNAQLNEYRAEVKAHADDMEVSTSGIAYGRRVYLFGAVNQFGAANGIPVKVAKLGPKEEADIARENPDPTAFAAAYEKRRLEIEQRVNSNKSRDMYFANIAELPLEVAKKAVDIVQRKIDAHEDVGMIIHARNGNQVISDMNTYLTSLKDYIRKHDMTISPSNPTAISAYAQVQDMVAKEA